MSDEKNVGSIDGVIRIVLGIICLGLIAYHFIIESILPIYAIILLIILIPFFFKTGTTKICPIMKAMNLSTLKKED